jgi:hypothetical protein
MESCHYAELSTDLKVPMQIKEFTDASGKRMLVLSLATFAHNLMDGSIKALTADQLVVQAEH